MPPKMRDTFSSEEIERFRDTNFLLSQMIVPAGFNLSSKRNHGPKTLQRLITTVMTRPKQASHGAGWADEKGDPKEYPLSEIQRKLNAQPPNNFIKESFQKVKYSDAEYRPEPATGTVTTDRVGEDQIATILYVCDWEAKDSGAIVVWRQLNPRFLQAFWLTKFAGPMDVVRSVWTAACTQSGEGSLHALVNKVEGTAVAKDKFVIFPNNELGRGCYGVLHLATHMDDNEGTLPVFLAAKVVPITDRQSPSDDDLRLGLIDLLKELEALSRIDRDRYLPALYGHSIDMRVHTMTLYMTKCCGEPAKGLIEPLYRLGEPVISWMIHDVLQALQHLHENGIVHRDLHLGNVLLRGWETALTVPQLFSACVVDLGNCHIIPDIADRTVGQEGFRREKRRAKGGGYQAPEFLLGHVAASRSMDIWSTACLAARPLLNDARNSLMMAKENDVNKDILAGYAISDDAKAFVNACWAMNPKDRPLAADLLAHPWITGHQEARGHMMQDD